jgi:orotate phosphoribosyltransferase
VPLTSQKTLELFERKGAYLRGHFRLTSGLHSPEYLQCALVLQYPDAAQQLAEELVSGVDQAVDVVVAPAIGGLIIGHEVARALQARFIFSERDAVTRHMSLRRGFEVRGGERALVVEDVVTTGGSSAEVIDLLLAADTDVVAAACIIDRSGGRVKLGVPRLSLATLDVVTYHEYECPMCKAGEPVVKPGSRPL